jgi:hypothetical protein
MHLRYPIDYFFQQTARYALMLEKEHDASHFYSLIIQRPFSFLGLEKDFPVDKGSYRSQAYVFKKFSYSGEFISLVKSKTLMEYASNSLLMNNFSLQKLIQEYRSKENNLPSHCNNCFSNKKNDFSCKYLLTGEKSIWE